MEDRTINQKMDALGVSSGAAGLISLGIKVCQGLLDYYNSWKDAESRVLEMYASMEALTKTLVLLQGALRHELFDRNAVTRVEECIQSLSKGLQSLQKKLNKVQAFSAQDDWKARAKAQFHRTLFPFKESTLVKLKELSNEMRDDLTVALELLHIDSSIAALQKLDLVGKQLNDVSTDVGIMRGESNSIFQSMKDVQLSTTAISGSVSHLVSTQSKDLTRQVCGWLSPLSANFQRRQLDTYHTLNRQDGMAQTVLETPKFKNWMNGNGEILWCPGIGK